MQIELFIDENVRKELLNAIRVRHAKGFSKDHKRKSPERQSACSSLFLNKSYLKRLAIVRYIIGTVRKTLISWDSLVKQSLDNERIRLTTVQSTSVLKLNLHPNSPKIQLRVNRLLLKKIMPTKTNKYIHLFFYSI